VRIDPKNQRAKWWFQCRLIYLALFENKVEVTSDLKLSQEIGTNIFFSGFSRFGERFP